MGEMEALPVFFFLVSGLIAARMAKKRGRNPIVWFGIGAVANVFLLGVYLFLQHRKNRRQSDAY